MTKEPRVSIQSNEPLSVDKMTPQFYHEIAKIHKLSGTWKSKDGEWLDNNFPLTSHSTHVKLGTSLARKVLEYNENGLPVIHLQNFKQKTLVKNLLKRLQAKGIDFRGRSKVFYLVAETRDSIGEKPMAMVSFWKRPPRLSLCSRMVYFWEEGNFQFWISTKSAFKIFLSRVIYKINLEDFKEALDESN